LPRKRAILLPWDDAFTEKSLALPRSVEMITLAVIGLGNSASILSKRSGTRKSEQPVRL